MKIYRKIRTVLLNFNNKMIRGINFGERSKKFLKLQVSTIRLNDSWKTQNQSIEKNDTAEYNGKMKMCLLQNEKHFVTIWIKLSIFMPVTPERGNLIRLYKILYTQPP